MNKTVEVHYRVTPETANTIKNKAQQAGLTMTEYVTRLIHSDLEPIEKDTLAKIYKELAAIGNNINQIAHKANMNMYDRKDIELLASFQSDILKFKMDIGKMRKKYQ